MSRSLKSLWNMSNMTNQINFLLLTRMKKLKLYKNGSLKSKWRKTIRTWLKILKTFDKIWKRNWKQSKTFCSLWMRSKTFSLFFTMLLWFRTFSTVFQNAMKTLKSSVKTTLTLPIGTSSKETALFQEFKRKITIKF